MKKLISLLLILSMIVMMPFEVAAQGTPKTEDDLILLPPKANQTTEIRTRKQVDGLRMYVDVVNPSEDNFLNKPFLTLMQKCS